MVELAVAEQRPIAVFGQGAGLEDLRGLCAGVLAALPALTRRSAPTTVTHNRAAAATRR
jgi:hypothetical protein